MEKITNFSSISIIYRLQMVPVQHYAAGREQMMWYREQGQQEEKNDT